MPLRQETPHSLRCSWTFRLEPLSLSRLVSAVKDRARGLVDFPTTSDVVAVYWCCLTGEVAHAGR